MRGLTRRLLSNGNHIGIDVVKSQPNILYQCCIEYSNYIPLHLGNYIQNIKLYLKEVQDQYNVYRTVAKTLFIRLCYGGHFVAWAKDNNLTVDKHCPFVENFYNEWM